MKNLLVVLMALALIGSASAWGIEDVGGFPYTFPQDGNLTNLTPDVWGTWGGDAGGSGSVVVSGGQCTVTTSSYEIAFSHDNDIVDLGITAGTDKIELVINVVSITSPNAIIKIEQHPIGNSFPNPDNGAGSIVVDAWDPDTTITGPGEYHFVTAAVCDPLAVAVTPVFGCTGAGDIVVDMIWVGPEGGFGGGTKATDPIPENNSVQPTGTVSSLSWTNPDPLNGTDPLTVSVKFDIEPGPIYDSNDNNVSTGGGTDIETIALSTMTNPPTTPLPDGYYSWQVTITDPNTTGGGVPVVTVGNVWLFEVGDAPPVPGQPVNQYMWLSQDDSALGDSNPNVRYFQVTATYTDDGKTPITVADFNNLNWGWDPLGPDGIVDTGDEQRGVTEVSDVHTPATKTVTAVYRTEYTPGDPNYQTDIMGYWDIRLEVTDGTGTALGTAGHHEIWDYCAEAANSDPDDTFDITYDANQNCKNDLPDFAAFAAVWLDQSAKFE